jgi:hypothetical protein
VYLAAYLGGPWRLDYHRFLAKRPLGPVWCVDAQAGPLVVRLQVAYDLRGG